MELLMETTREGFLDMDEKFKSIPNHDGIQEGSTALAVWVTHSHTIVANCGDCTAVIVRSLLPERVDVLPKKTVCEAGEGGEVLWEAKKSIARQKKKERQTRCTNLDEKALAVAKQRVREKEEKIEKEKKKKEREEKN